jgi:glycosyltransferase involved in cell wall biosynthesis
MKAIESLSIIVPIYNGELFLRDAVQSILNQSWLPQSFEVLLIDDASNDKSIEVARSLEKLSKDIRLVALENNRGVASARNTGIQLAQYEHLAFLDQDDTWHSSKLELQQSAIKNYRDVDYMLGRQSFSLYQIDQWPQWLNPSWHKAPQKGWVPGTLIIEKLKFLDVGFFDEKYRHGGDDVDWFARAHHKKLRYQMLDDVILHRKVHALNTSRNTLPSNLELLKLIKSKLDRSNA